MNDISIFLNNSVVHRGYRINDSMGFGDKCLKPVRYLFNGNKVTIDYGCILEVDHKPEFWRRDPVKKAAALALLIPSVIVGGTIKLIGYLNESKRWDHSRVRSHYAPIERVDIGSDIATLEVLQKDLGKYKGSNNWYHRPVKNLVIHAKEGTEINEDPGFEGLYLEKIILVGARIIHQPSRNLDDFLLRNGWKGDGNNVTQHKVASVEEAMESRGAPKRVFIVG